MREQLKEAFDEINAFFEKRLSEADVTEEEKKYFPELLNYAKTLEAKNEIAFANGFKFVYGSFKPFISVIYYKGNDRDGLVSVAKAIRNVALPCDSGGYYPQDVDVENTELNKKEYSDDVLLYFVKCWEYAIKDVSDVDAIKNFIFVAGYSVYHSYGLSYGILARHICEIILAFIRMNTDADPDFYQSFVDYCDMIEDSSLT